ncbi:PQQ-dependent sugar dehydrogenase [Xanthomonas translucens]|uniref:Secreted protein n=1 Tax=Xanthomonas translucens pv. translucens DSM 18974 TaxID=1261556 RepID=A0A1C3TJ89_XANCT|nr:PQQ-dependent sugar dehydrogenase [Xanthomonas translucens]KTF39997.1 glucose dehydrogenase [Xanthomonas translucens pv. translucens]KWV10195.1 glucose dehydrogenase [Xanthomonas translucens]MCC8448268.1 PQQ-dependent sugar dehydrogenase [Xanthomonas translucens pv. translucens]MCS3360963.1 PQQ-dependent sugar dehydrogenase [Xanthomonas translucens pv. translucens]MCS3374807.1 PQQ-dependent sugar dehydrogenase [Xanthomonas translucens pv. translucens]
MQRSFLGLVCALLLSLAVSAADAAPAASSAERRGDWPFSVTPFATFNEPWAMSFLPDGSALITEKGGTLKRFDPGSGRTGTVSGVPAVDYGGQGGFGDVLPHPDFAQNGWLYLSYVEAGSGDTRGAAVARAKLTLDANGGGALSQLQVIWRQQPKVSGTGHYGHRLAFDPDGKLWISSSERQKFDPAQDMNSNLGKIVRLNDDGSVPADNPFARRGGVAAQVWSLGHRNVLGLAFDANGQLWEHEMGPAGGDELNLIQRGANYGYPIVSNGDHYDGRPIPDHSTRPQFAAPKLSWTPVISPAGFVIYSGSAFPQWRGNGFIGGLSSQSLLRIEFDGDHAREAARYDMGKRIREVEQGPDGALWLLEDGSSARLLKLQPMQS